MRPPPRTAPFTAGERQSLTAFARQAKQSSLAHSSRTQYNSTVKLYSNFCGLLDIEAFPPSLMSLSLYMADYVMRDKVPTNLPGILSQLRRHCMEEDIPWLSPGDDKRLSYMRQGLKRLAPRRDVKRAKACTLDVIHALFAAVTQFHAQTNGRPSNREPCILTMCLLAHNGLLRSGELLALTVGDVSWDSATECRIRILESKTDHSGCQDSYPTSATRLSVPLMCSANIGTASS